jgi:hypothetical protein
MSALKHIVLQSVKGAGSSFESAMSLLMLVHVIRVSGAAMTSRPRLSSTH